MEIPIPLTEESIDTSDGLGALTAIAMLSLGFMFFAFARTAGQTMFATVNNVLQDTLGVGATGGDNGPGGV